MNKEYIFLKRRVLGNSVLVLSQDHSAGFSKSPILFAIDEIDFLNKIKDIEIDAKNKIDYRFDFPARKNPYLLPKILYPNDVVEKSPDIKKPLQKFEPYSFRDRPTQQTPTPFNFITTQQSEEEEEEDETITEQIQTKEPEEMKTPFAQRNDSFTYSVVSSRKTPSTEPAQMKTSFAPSLNQFKNNTSLGGFIFETPNENRTMDPQQRQQNILNQTFSGSSAAYKSGFSKGLRESLANDTTSVNWFNRDKMARKQDREHRVMISRQRQASAASQNQTKGSSPKKKLGQ